MKRAAPADPKCPSTGSAADFLPRKIELPALSEAASKCQGCTLYCNATQTVFGEGPANAIVMFIGEQPGDQEDRAGKPFVGPSGKVLDAALQEAGIPREKTYVTNAVKHFKWEPRGQRRIHSKPSSREIAACRPWLEAEIQVVRPRVIVCLGATAAQSLLGSAFRLTQHRGEVNKDSKWAPNVLATLHPSSILRLPDHDAREAARRSFVEDMKIVAKYLGAKPRRTESAPPGALASELSTKRELIAAPRHQRSQAKKITASPETPAEGRRGRAGRGGIRSVHRGRAKR